MKYAIVADVDSESAARLVPQDSPGVHHLLFGDTLFIHTADSKWSEAAAYLPAERAEGERIARGHLHLVQQKGRSFQDEHPDVPVLLDKGRFLVVDLPAASMRDLPTDTHFRVLPLPPSGTVVKNLPATDRAPDPQIDAVVADLQQQVFEDALAALTAARTRLSTSPDYAAVATWCQSRLVSMGLPAQVVPFPMPTGGSSSNVIATKAGTAPATDRRTVIVCAHLDSVNHRGGPSAPAPGADDNGSGSAGLLALAQVLSGRSLSHDLTFVLFGGEEQGLHGSRHYLAALPADDRARVLGVLNMDMIGTVNALPQAVMLEGAQLSQAMIDGLAQAGHTYTQLAIQTSLHPFASDHVPFIDAGIPAVLTIEGGDSSNGAIHSDRDTIDRVDPAFALQILAMNAAWLATTAVPATGPPTPCPCGCGGDCSQTTPGCTDCGDTDADTRTLKAHYQALFAQYNRLAANGVLRPQDHASWNTLHSAYDLVGQSHGHRR